MSRPLKINSKYHPSGDQPMAIDALVQGLHRDEERQILMGVTGSGKTFTMAKVIEEVQRPTLILSHNKTLAAQLYGEFKMLFPENAVEFFISYYDFYQPEAYIPITDSFIEKDATVNEEINKLRLRTTSSLLSRRDVIVVASVSCIFGIGSPQEYLDQMVSLSVGGELKRRPFFRQLIEIHYRRNDLVLERGAFRVRGDSIELFPSYFENAVRIELLDDNIENIFEFNPVTGKILQEISTLALFPAKHFVTTEENMMIAIDKILDELDEQIIQFTKEGKLLEAQRIKQRTMFDIEMMREIGYCSGIENYSRHIDNRVVGERPNTLLDFFSDDFLVFFDESHVSIPQIRGMYKGDRSRKSVLVEYGFRLPSAYDNRPMTLQEVEEKVESAVFVSATPADYEFDMTGGAFVEQIIRPTGLLDPEIILKSTKHQVDDLMNEIVERIKLGDKCLVLTLTIKMSEDLADYLQNLNFRVKYLHSKIKSVERVKILRDLRLGKFDVLVGINLLREGLDLPEVSLVAILDADKEGFLRSEKSLFQISGRASRNDNGKVIFYADKMTDSMKKVMDETARRRKLQQVFNRKNGIIPQTVKKTHKEILESTAVADIIRKEPQRIDVCRVDSFQQNFEKETLVELLQKEMMGASENLEFEKAAALRDEINRIRNE